MTNHELETQLRNALHSPGVPIPPEQVQKTLSLTRASIAKKAPLMRLSYWAFLGTQVRFIGWKIWLSQIILLLLLTGMLLSVWNSLLESPVSVGILLSGCSFLVFLTALPFLYRSRRYQMSEVEMAVRFSGVKQLGAKLLIIGIGDFSMLCSLFCLTLVKTRLEPDRVCLYLLLPFLVSTNGLLYLIGHTPLTRLAQNSVVVCGGTFLGFVLLTRLTSPSLNLTPVGFIACALLALFCAYQGRTIFYHSPNYEEIQLL